TEQRRRFESLSVLLPLLGRPAAESTVRGLLVERPPTGDRRRPPALTGQHPGVRTLPIPLALRRAECGEDRPRMHQRDKARHVAEPEAGDQTRLQRELVPQTQGVALP